MSVPDNLDFFNEYESRQEAELSKLPKCSECGEHIQDEECFEINGKLVCCDCLKENYRKWTEDYIR